MSEIDRARIPKAICQVAPDALRRPENDGVTLLHGGDRYPFLMNATAAEMLDLLSTARTLREVVSEMAGRYPHVPEAALTEDVLGFVVRLAKERYVTIVPLDLEGRDGSLA